MDGIIALLSDPNSNSRISGSNFFWTNSFRGMSDNNYHYFRWENHQNRWSQFGSESKQTFLIHFCHFWLILNFFAKSAEYFPCLYRAEHQCRFRGNLLTTDEAALTSHLTATWALADNLTFWLQSTQRLIVKNPLGFKVQPSQRNGENHNILVVFSPC